MTNRNSKLILLLAVGAILVAFALIVFNSSQVESTNGASRNKSRVETSTNITLVPPKIEQAPLPTRQERIDRAVANQNVPISFWGRVLDQFENPLPDVEVITTVKSWNNIGPIVGSTFETNVVRSDQQGRFSITGKKGGTFVIRQLRKVGYELAQGSDLGFNFSGAEAFRSNPDNPVVYHMWKLKGAEPTIVHMINRRMPCDGTPVLVNLSTGAIAKHEVPNADLKIVVNRNPVQSPSDWNQRFDWDVSIDALSGGLIETEDRFMYWAPDGNYEKGWSKVFKKDSPDWRSSLVFKAYIKNRAGKYARVEIGIRAEFSDDRVGLSINSCLNPSGSRNLEYDEAKQ